MTQKTELGRLAKRIADCESKSAYKRKGDAMIFANRHGWNQVPYRCVVCGDWHLTKDTEFKVLR